MCLRLNKMKEEEEAKANQFRKASAEQLKGWKFVNRVGGAVQQLKVINKSVKTLMRQNSISISNNKINSINSKTTTTCGTQKPQRENLQ